MDRFKGSGFLVSVCLAATVTALSMFSLANVLSYSFNGIQAIFKNHRIVHLAEGKMDMIKANGYSSVTAQPRLRIGSTQFYDEVVLGSESNYQGEIKQRPVTVNIYDGKGDIPCFSLDSNVYKVSESGGGGCQVVTGTGSVSFISNGTYKTMTIIVASKFNPANGTWTGSATCAGYVNSVSVGTLSTSTKTTRGGSKGHYWGTNECVTNMVTFSRNIVSGDSIKASITSSSSHESSTITVILGV